jgi:hypothetical protein
MMISPSCLNEWLGTRGPPSRTVVTPGAEGNTEKPAYATGCTLVRWWPPTSPKGPPSGRLLEKVSVMAYRLPKSLFIYISYAVSHVAARRPELDGL